MTAKISGRDAPMPYSSKRHSDLISELGDAPRWLIEPGIARGRRLVLNADYGAGKTTLACELIGLGLTGGKNDIFSARTKFKTLIIYNESSESFRYYFEAFAKRNKIPQALVDSEIMFVDLGEGMNREFFSPLTKAPKGPNFRERMELVFQDFKPDLIFLDSAQFLLTGSKNDDSAVKELFIQWADVSRSIDAAEMVTWLSNKHGRGVAGSNDFPGLADVVLQIEGKSRGKPRTVSSLKMRLGRSVPKFQFTIHAVDKSGVRLACRNFKVSTKELKIDPPANGDAVKVIGKAAKPTAAPAKPQPLKPKDSHKQETELAEFIFEKLTDVGGKLDDRALNATVKAAWSTLFPGSQANDGTKTRKISAAKDLAVARELIEWDGASWRTVKR